MNVGASSSSVRSDLQLPLRDTIPHGVTHREFQIRVVSKSGTLSQNPFGGAIFIWNSTFALPATLQAGVLYGLTEWVIQDRPTPSDYAEPSISASAIYYTAPPAVDLAMASWPGHFQDGQELDSHIVNYYCPAGVWPPHWQAFFANQTAEHPAT